MNAVTVKRIALALSIGIGWVAADRLSAVTVEPQHVPAVIVTLGFLAACVHRWRLAAAPGLIIGIAAALVTSALMDETLLAASIRTLAAVVGGLLLAWIVTSLTLDMTRSSQPTVLAAAAVLTALTTGVGSLALGQSAWTSWWSAAALGSILVLTTALTFQGWRAIQHPVECTAVVAAGVALAASLLTNRFESAAVGFVAWVTLPLLLLIGVRYGKFAASLVADVLGLATVWALVRRGDVVSEAQVLQRQIVCVLLVCVTFSLLILLRQQRDALARVRASQEATLAFLANADPMWYIKRFPDGVARYDSLGGGSFRGWSDVSSVTDEELFGVEAAASMAVADRAVLNSGVGSVGLESLRMPEGTHRTFVSNRFPIKDAKGHTVAVGGMRTDVTHRERAAAVNQRQSHLLEAMFEFSPVPTMRVSRTEEDDLLVSAANHALGLVVGRPSGDLIGTSVAGLVDHDDWSRADSLFEREPPRQPLMRWHPQAEVRLHTRIGGHRLVLVTVAPLWIDVDQPVEYLVHLEDVTARRAAEDAVARYSLFDNATGLLNRVALSDRLDAALHRIPEEEAGVALVVLDIDDFKSVNDSYGHGAGDRLLVEYSRRLRAVCGRRDGVARLGADEFAIVTDWRSQASTGLLVGRIQEALSAPVEFNGEPIACTAAFGVAVAKQPDISAGELVRQAELALFRAKRAGRGRVEFYAESMRVQAQAALNVRNELARAVATNGFQANYQPIVRLRDGQVTDYEALVRLPTSDGRLLLPGEFLDVARSADLLPVMDRMMVRQALADVAAGRLPVPSAGVSINSEAEELRDPEFAMRVLEVLHSTGVDPSRLTVEVTESALLQLDDAVLSNVRTLRDVGVQFSIDDFGTGYSSLAQLRNLSVDILKIDRSFVIEMENDSEAANIVATVIGLSHSLGLVAVAEGIETRGQAEALNRLACDFGQGNLFGSPLPIDPLPTVPTQERKPLLEEGSADR